MLWLPFCPVVQKLQQGREGGIRPRSVLGVQGLLEQRSYLESQRNKDNGCV